LIPFIGSEAALTFGVVLAVVENIGFVIVTIAAHFSFGSSFCPSLRLGADVVNVIAKFFCEDDCHNINLILSECE
jgi:hypothetical protein